MKEKINEKIKNEEESNEKGIDENKAEVIHRLSISKLADEGLTEIVERVNDGFEGGRVNRSQVANWILTRFSSSCSEADIQQIRAENVNELAVLEAILRKARKSGKLPHHLSALIQKHLGFDEPARKGSKNRLTKNIINDDIEELDE